MVKISTLFFRVDGFEESEALNDHPEILDQTNTDHFLDKLLKPLVFDPGEALVQKVLQKI